MQYQWACGEPYTNDAGVENTADNNMYRCMQPEWCSAVNPTHAANKAGVWNGPVTGSSYGNTIESGETTVWSVVAAGTD